MLSLFSTKSDTAGFRLNFMEFYNWGTFDNEIIKIEPQGHNSLLTGANGSGKTTFIDALLTLLVPQKRDRFYNQSSGSEKKGDRTEDSYVRGDYGTIQKEGHTKTTRQTLRTRETYSILLASFANTDGKIVTLFQLRWYSGEDMKRCFGIARVPLHIEKDFPDFDFQGLWKSRLEQQYNQNTLKNKIDFYDDQPVKYAKKLTSLFGMRSLKALKLFNQAVGIKVLEDLDGFIRDNMLEDKDPEAKYIELNSSFITLRSAKIKIDKTKEQLRRLEPINELATSISEANNSLKTLEDARDKSVLWFSNKGKEVYENEKEQLEYKRQTIQDKIDILEKNEKQTIDDLGVLNHQIENDAVSSQISKLTNDKNILDEKRSKRQEKLDTYNTISKQLGLDQNPNEENFEINLKSAIDKNIIADTDRTNALKKEISLDQKITDLSTEMTDTGESIKTLRENGNNISPQVARIRQNILDYIGASRSEIPFIGEIIKIADGEEKWQASIEKVLHSFAMRLIVPEKYYQEVNKYVRDTNLEGKITYLRLKQSAYLNKMDLFIPADDHILGKVEFKPNSPYAEFVENSIKERYNYLCAENLNDFKGATKAIMVEGLIKRGGGNHEKDDRTHINSKSNYVLGWDNKAKILSLRQHYQILKDTQEKVVVDKKIVTKSITDLADTIKKINKLIEGYTSFDDINWEKYALEIEEINDTINSLKEGNKKAQAFQKEKTRLESKIKTNKLSQKSKGEEIYNINRDLKAIKDELEEFVSAIKKFADNEIDLSEFESNQVGLDNISYKNFNATRVSFQSENSLAISKLIKNIGKYREDVVKKISSFVNPDKSTLENFPDWGSDLGELTENLDHLYIYQKLYNQLIKDDLPSFQSRFDKYLEDTIIDKIGAFNFYFEKWGEEIRGTIKTLNESLIEINFDGEPDPTYIQLMHRMQVKEQASDFRKLLHQALPDVSQINTIEKKREHFETFINPLIAKLEDINWRKKAMDVRLWFDYKAEKYFREDGSKDKTYEGMGQLSGGQKAQLTYTILGAAIAYQFGLTSQGLESNSFRFIAIDEAFKAQDDEKSKYLLELCKQLHLQILVVTPSDGIEIVEPYISYVHFTEIENEKKSSLYDMTIGKFEDERHRLIEEK